jgi:hypothetical protein
VALKWAAISIKWINGRRQNKSNAIDQWEVHTWLESGWDCRQCGWGIECSIVTNVKISNPIMVNLSNVKCV